MVKMKMHHIGIATENIADMKAYLQNLLEIRDCTQTVYDANQDADLCMVTLTDGTKIELIAGKVVEKLVKKRNFLYHTCYEVEDIDVAIGELVEQGAMLVSEPKEAILFDNQRVAFLTSPLGLMELVERNQ
ncbi:MAG: VOC family protein [Lachnospiraceae bacterium]|nr:VOC family protein [Lachnospiraceae bacterium]